MTEKFVIIGGGISGLSLCWYLKKKFSTSASIKIVEKNGVAGGWIESRHQGGYLFEKGPRSCRTAGSGLNTLQFIEELGLKAEVIGASSDAKKRYIYFNEKLEELPNSIYSFVKSPLTKGLIYAIWKDFWNTKKTLSVDETIADFGARRLNSKITERLIDPVISGIYAGDIHHLSLRSCFPDLYNWDQKNRSILTSLLASTLKSFTKAKECKLLGQSDFIQKWSKEPIFSFRHGMGTLIDQLVEHLKPELHDACVVKSLKLSSDSVHVTLSDGQLWQADKVFLATPFDVTLPLLQNAGVNIRKSPSLETSSVAVVNMGWKKQVLESRGFGYLIPHTERQKNDSGVLGVVFDSLTFPSQNLNRQETRLTVMLGGTCHPQIAEMPFDKIEEMALQALKKHLNINTLPDEIHVSVAKRAIPQYLQGHSQMVQDLENELSQKTGHRLCLLGSSWYGVSVNDCILKSKLIAEATASNGQNTASPNTASP